MTPQVEDDFKTLPELLALCIWREARGEDQTTRLGVGCSIRNRVLRPSWWGSDYASVILKPWQYSSFNSNDPNCKKYPRPQDATEWQAWQECLRVAQQVIDECDDCTHGADSYFDQSLDNNPPIWVRSPRAQRTCQIGRLYFYKTV